jgi:predicted ester cyclase
MSLAENKAIVRRWIDEFWNQGNLDLVDEIVAPGFISHRNGVRGREGCRAWLGRSQAIFPDFEFTIEDLIAEGDKVVYRYTCSGTPAGEWLGLAPTGKRVKWTGISIAHIVDGLIAELWGDYDKLGAYQQLGGILTTGESEA